MNDPHRRARRLLSDRMDDRLTPEASRWLEAHLSGCARCRSVDRAYADGQRSLRALRPSVPPRDLGARILASLDSELRRGARTGGGGAAVPAPRAVALGVIASVGACVVVLGARLLPGQPVPTTPIDARVVVAAATPFAVPDAELALVDVGTDGLTVYQASMNLVCPASARDDCATASIQTRHVPGVAQGVVPRDLSLDLTRRLALVAEDAMGSESVSVLVLPPLDLPGTDEPRGLGRGPDGRDVGLLAGPRTPQGDIVSPPRGDHLTLEPRVEPVLTAILDDVEAVGAPPAWSPDGQMLAFSAMPSDRSRGPDVYVWRTGDERAHRVTDDRSSWFASWSGSRLVVNRVHGDGPRRSATTLLVDPLTKRSQVAPLGGAWMPIVDPSGRFAVAWRGTIAGNGPTIRPRTGELTLIDWTLVDPAASGRPPSALGTASAVRESGRHRARVIAGAQAPGRTGPRSTGVADGDRGWLEPIESSEGDAGPVLDWQVSWAETDTTFGYWVADANGAAWGRLTVLRVLPAQRRIDRGVALLGPTLARRSFTLGVDRVAWVAPTAEGADGELRVRTWTESGEGSLRLAGIRLRHGIPAF